MSDDAVAGFVMPQVEHRSMVTYVRDTREFLRSIAKALELQGILPQIGPCAVELHRFLVVFGIGDRIGIQRSLASLRRSNDNVEGLFERVERRCELRGMRFAVQDIGSVG